MTSSSHCNQKLFHPSVNEAFIQQQYGLIRFNQFYGIAKSTKNFVQRLTRWKVLEGHDGCVNTVAWNENGSLLLSGSDDYLLNVYNVYQNKLLHSIESGHQANIFSAKFLPCTSDTKVRLCYWILDKCHCIAYDLFHCIWKGRETLTRAFFW